MTLPKASPPPTAAVPAAVFFALLGPAAVGGGLALAPLQLLAGLAAAPFGGLWRGMKAAWPVLALAAAFVAFAAVSAAWSPYQPESLEQQQGLKLALCALAAALFGAAAGAGPRTRALARAAGAAGCAVLILILSIEVFTDMALNRMAQPAAEYGALQRNPGRGVTVLVVLAFGAIGALLNGDLVQRALWRVLLLATGALSLQFDMAGNAVGFAAGLVAFVFAWRAPRTALSLLGVGLAAWVVVTPFVLSWLAGQEGLAQALPLSWQVRLDIWAYVAPRIAEAPFLGHGLDASRAVTGLGQVGDLTFPQVPLHPHSAPLQVWYELGAVGAGLLAALLAAGGLMAGRALQDQPAAAAAAAGAFTAVAVFWSISYGAWQEWMIALVGIGLALANAARRYE